MIFEADDRVHELGVQQIKARLSDPIDRRIEVRATIVVFLWGGGL